MVFSIAAGENLNPVFRSMGFRDLPDLSDLNLTQTATWSDGTQDATSSTERNPLVAFVAGLLLVVIAATVIVLAVISTRRARRDYQISSDTYYEF